VAIPTASATLVTAADATDIDVEVATPYSNAPGMPVLALGAGGGARATVVSSITPAGAGDPPSPPARVRVDELRGLGIPLPVGSTLRANTLAHDVGVLERASAYRALWRLTYGGGRVETRFETFDVVRQPFGLAITLTDVRNLAPDFPRIGGSTFQRLLRGAEGRVLFWLRARGIAPDRVRDARTFDHVGAWLVIQLATADRPVGGGFDERTLARVDKMIDDLWRDLAKSSYWYDTDDDGLRGASEPGGADGLRAVNRMFPGLMGTEGRPRTR
jgi:hypothetical protein